MNKVQGIAIETIEVEGRSGPAFVIRISRAKQWRSFLGFLLVAVLSLIVLFNASYLTNFLHLPADFSICLSILTLVILLAGAFGALTGFWALSKPPTFLALLQEGIFLFAASGSALVPWTEITEMQLMAMAEVPDQRIFLALRLRAPDEIPSLQEALGSIVAQQANTGWHFLWKLLYFEASPETIETAAQIFFHHSEKRAEIGTETGLATIASHLEANWGPPESTPRSAETPDFSDPENRDVLLNWKLQHSMEALSENDSPTNRRNFHQVLLEITFYVPAYEQKEGLAQIFGVRNENNELSLTAFSDPMALQRWPSKPPFVLVLAAQELFKAAVEYDFAEILINTVGLVGWKLTLEEFSSLADGIIPD